MMNMWGDVTPATRMLLAKVTRTRRAPVRRKRRVVARAAPKRRKRVTRAAAPRRRARATTRARRPARMVKGSAAAKRYMAKLRRMRRR